MEDKTFEISLTKSQLENLNRVFGIIGEEALKANWFTKSDIEDIYGVYGKVLQAIEEKEIDEAYADLAQ
jgi:hypothetical protein